MTEVIDYKGKELTKFNTSINSSHTRAHGQKGGLDRRGEKHALLGCGSEDLERSGVVRQQKVESSPIAARNSTPQRRYPRFLLNEAEARGPSASQSAGSYAQRRSASPAHNGIPLCRRVHQTDVLQRGRIQRTRRLIQSLAWS